VLFYPAPRHYGGVAAEFACRELVGAQLASSYTVYASERHGISHLGTEMYNMRSLPNLTPVRPIITKVFDYIEAFGSKLPKCISVT
jgi:hypothetical protein